MSKLIVTPDEVRAQASLTKQSRSQRAEAHAQMLSQELVKTRVLLMAALRTVGGEVALTQEALDIVQAQGVRIRVEPGEEAMKLVLEFPPEEPSAPTEEPTAEAAPSSVVE